MVIGGVSCPNWLILFLIYNSEGIMGIFVSLALLHKEFDPSLSVPVESEISQRSSRITRSAEYF